MPPLVIVVSAPSGAGKTTLCDMLLKEHPQIRYSVSCTTRAPRGDEVDGRDYIFLDDAGFDARVAAGAFVEHARVHGHRYGTLWATLEGALAAGYSVLMDIDVQGAAQIRAAMAAGGRRRVGGRWVDIFIAPPSLEVLGQRLQRRGEDAPAAIAARLRNAAGEMAQAGAYRYRVVNDDVARAYADLRRIVRKEMAAATGEGP